MKPVSEWKGLTIHHSLTKDSKSLSWNAIKKYHIETNDWSDIGYHYGIELVEDKVEILYGRSIDYAGAHCPGLNNTHIGICVVGNYDLIEPPEAHIERLVALCAWCCKSFDIDPKEIEYHSEHSHKTCPGSKFITKESLIKKVAELL